MPSPIMRTTCEDAYGNSFHYFASSVAEWQTGTDLDKIIGVMKRSGFPFSVYRVDLPETAGYPVEGYRPKVPDEQLHHVGFWETVKSEVQA